MARPLDPKKRENLLKTATELIANEGPSVATARIAEVAEESVGTLFRYFENKDGLLNQLYLTLKDDLHAAMVKDYRETSNAMENARQMWNAYISWGRLYPEKRNALLQLDVCDLVTPENKQRGAAQFTDVFGVIYSKEGPEAPMTSFAAAIMASLAAVSITFMTQQPRRAHLYRDLGFETLWTALAKLDDPAYKMND